MAETFVKYFLHRMKYLLIQEVKTFVDLEEGLNRLMTNLQKVGSSFEKLGIVESNPATVNSWVNEFRNLIFDAENQIDKFIIHMNRAEGSLRECLQDDFRSELQKIECSLAEKVTTIANIHGSDASESSDSSEAKLKFNNLP